MCAAAVLGAISHILAFPPVRGYAGAAGDDADPPRSLPAPTQLVAVAPATEDFAADSGRIYCRTGSEVGCNSYFPATPVYK